MDDQRFDGIARLLAGGRSRRGVLKGIFGAALGIGVAAPAALKATNVAAACFSYGITCSADSDCCTGLMCISAYGSTPSCGLPFGATCGNGPENCGQGLECEGGTCKRGLVQPCTSTSDCQSYYECDATTSTCRVPLGSQCEGSCVTGAICCYDGYYFCRVGDCCSSGDGENNGTCPTEGDTCINNVCTSPCVGVSEACEVGGDCCDYLYCFEGVCTIPTAAITVHLRCCPEGATDVYADCHDNGIAGVAVELDAVQSVGTGPGVYAGVTDADGNFTFIIEYAGPWTVLTELDGAPISVYCSYLDEVGTETYLDISGGIILPLPFTEVVCDMYYVGVCEVPTDTGGDDGGDTELPETGAGSSASSLIAGAAIVAGGAALLGKVLKGSTEA